MSAYATASDLDAILDSSLRDELKTADADITAALQSASDDINGYVSAARVNGLRVVVPVTGALSLGILRSHCLALAKFKIISRKGGGKFDQNALEEFKTSIDFLKSFLSKTPPLLPDAQTETIAVSSSTISLLSDAPIFSEDYSGYL
jgi:phage gp36-like protein